MMMDNQDSHHHVCYIAYWIFNICEISVREIAYSGLMFCLHREDLSVPRENEDVFWASDWTTRHTVCVADTAREAAVNCGWLLASEAFPLSTSDALPRHPVSASLTLALFAPHRTVILPPPSRIPLPSPWSALPFSLFASESPSSPSSSYFHHPRRERWFFNGQHQRTPVSATSARSRVNLIR